MANKIKQAIKPLLLGSLVVIITPLVTGLLTKVPALGSLDLNLKVITLLTAVSAGLTTAGAQYALNKIKATKTD